MPASSETNNEAITTPSLYTPPRMSGVGRWIAGVSLHPLDSNVHAPKGFPACHFGEPSVWAGLSSSGEMVGQLTPVYVPSRTVDLYNHNRVIALDEI